MVEKILVSHPVFFFLLFFDDSPSQLIDYVKKNMIEKLARNVVSNTFLNVLIPVNIHFFITLLCFQSLRSEKNTKTLVFVLKGKIE